MVKFKLTRETGFNNTRSYQFFEDVRELLRVLLTLMTHCPESRFTIEVLKQGEFCDLAKKFDLWSKDAFKSLDKLCDWLDTHYIARKEADDE